MTCCTEILFMLHDSPPLSVLDSYQLGNHECVQAVIATTFAGHHDRNFFVVGTAFNTPGESEPQKGRLLVFALSSTRQIQLVTALTVNGGVFDLKSYEGYLACCINSVVGLECEEKLCVRISTTSHNVVSYSHRSPCSSLRRRKHQRNSFQWPPIVATSLPSKSQSVATACSSATL